MSPADIDKHIEGLKALIGARLSAGCDVYSNHATLAVIEELERLKAAAGPRQGIEQADAARVLEWARDPARKPAQLAFTAGPERQAAYWMQIAWDEVTPHFSGIAKRKLEDLLRDGWTVSGYAIQRVEPDGRVRRGAITDGGMVLWWNGGQS